MSDRSRARQIVVQSGKGGAGKTFVTSSLAWLAGDAVFADCDVDASNLHLMLNPEILEEHEFWSGVAAQIDPAKCTGCGACVTACRFNAIDLSATDAKTALVDRTSCEGCGVCGLVCPVDAVSLHPEHRGDWFVSQTSRGSLVHARLCPGEENSGKLVEKVRSVASAIAERERAAWILIDGPPGTGCAAKSAVTGTDYVILVGEPSVSGVHDVARAADLAAQFGIPCGLIVNKSTLSERQVERLHALAAERGIDILGSIPYARSVTESITNLRPYPQDNEHDEISLELRSIWAKLSAAGERSARAG